MTAGRAIVLGPGEGPRLANPAGGEVTPKARGDETGGSLSVWETTAAPGEGPPVHRHLDGDELIYVLDGRIRFRLDDADHLAPAGSLVFIPRGLPHTWQNAGDHPARILFLLTPAAPGLERFFEHAAELPAGTRLAEAFGAFASDAGMEVLGPPLSQSA